MILTILTLGFTSVLFAQNTTAYDYLKRAPAVPNKACQLKDPEQNLESEEVPWWMDIGLFFLKKHN